MANLENKEQVSPEAANTEVVSGEVIKEQEIKKQTVVSPKTAKKQKEKKPSKIKAVFSELKKVTWPKGGTVVKQTGIVLSVVVIFAAVLLGVDRLLSLLLNWLISGVPSA